MQRKAREGRAAAKAWGRKTKPENRAGKRGGRTCRKRGTAASPSWPRRKAPALAVVFHTEGTLMSELIDLIFSTIVAGCVYLLFIRGLCAILKLFIQKFRFFVSSVLIAWLVELPLMYLVIDMREIVIFFPIILFPLLFTAILYINGKIRKTSFSSFEYIFCFALYIPSQLLLPNLVHIVFDIFKIPH